MSNEIKLANNRILLNSFLVNREIPDQFKIPKLDNPYNVPFGYIYCIENINSKKKYIGSVYATWSGIQNPSALMQLQKRASNYIYEYNCALESVDKDKSKRIRPIIQAMLDEGFQNFIMYPIAETTRETHIAAENYFISIYNTIADGYNAVKAYSSFRNENNPIGKKLSAEDKKIRSTGIICIHPNDKKIIFSDSMKLFGDYMNSSKDMIKNCNRTGKPYKGWYIFYTDEDKRSYILNNNVLNDQNKRPQDRHSDKAKLFYQTLYGTVTLFLRSGNKDYFPNFEFLTPLEYNNTK